MMKQAGDSLQQFGADAKRAVEDLTNQKLTDITQRMGDLVNRADRSGNGIFQSAGQTILGLAGNGKETFGQFTQVIQNLLPADTGGSVQSIAQQFQNFAGRNRKNEFFFCAIKNFI